MHRQLRSAFSLFVLLAATATLVADSAAAAPIAIADVKHDGPVDFEKEVLPILRRNCLACHSSAKAESDLVLESPQTILKGGSDGPAVVPGKGAESLLIKLASMQKESFMPPPGNEAKAKPLTPAELGLIKLWIDQGAKGEVKGAGSAITWQPLPPGINPIYSVAITADGQYAAASRANQIFVYHVPSKRELGRLTDPSLVGGIYKQLGVADLDLIQTLKFSPDGTWLASGGFRTVKLWHKPLPAKQTELAGIDGQTSAIVTSPDGKLAAIATGHKVSVFDISTGKKLTTIDGHSGPVATATFTADSKKLATGSHDKSLRIWSASDGQPLAKIDTPSAIQAVAIVGEGRLIATAGDDNVIRLWEVSITQADGAARPSKELAGHTNAVTSLVAVGPKGEQLLSSSADGTARQWDVASAAVIKTITHGSPIARLAASADGKRAATLGSDGSAKLWNLDDGKLVADLKGDLRTTLEVAELTRAAALAKKHVELAKKDLEEVGNRKKAEEDNQKKSAEALTKAQGEVTPKNDAAKKATDEKAAVDKALADATKSKQQADEAKKAADELLKQADAALAAAKVAQEAAGKIEGDAGVAAKTATEKSTGAVEALRKALEPQQGAAKKVAEDLATALAAAEKKQKDAMPAYQKAIDEQTAAQRTLDAAKRAVERAVASVKTAADAIPGFDALVKAKEAAAKDRDAAVAKATAVAKEAEKPARSVAFVPDGSQLVTVGDDGLLRTWDAATGAAMDVCGSSGPALTAVAFAGNRAITAGASGVGTVWSFPTTWNLARTIGTSEAGGPLTDRVMALDFSPDSQTLAVGSGEPSRSGEIKLFGVADGKKIMALKEPHSDTVNCLAFSPDGKQLASCAADRFVKLWNVADGKLIRSFEGHTHHVLAIAWRPDGRVLVSSGADMVLKVWDTRSGEQQRTIANQFTKEVPGLTFVGDDLVAACGGDAKVRVINTANGNNQRDLAGTTEYMYSVAASADGKTILAGGLDSVLRLWNDQGQELAKFAAPPRADGKTAAK